MNVNQIILGGEQFGLKDWGQVSKAELTKVFKHAIDIGFQEIDTSNIYGLGLSESNIKALQNKFCSNIKVSTKVGLNYKFDKESSRATIFRDSSEPAIIKSTKESLLRLGINKLETIYLHYPDPIVSIEESINSLFKLKKDELSNKIGICNCDSNIINNEIDLSLVDRYQTEINIVNYILNPDYYNRLIRNLKDNNVEIIAYSPLKRGLITVEIFENLAKIKSNKNDRRSRLDFFREDSNEILLVKKIIEFCNYHKINLHEIAINFITQYLNVDKVIVGFTKHKQINQFNLKAKFDTDIYLELLNYVK